METELQQITKRLEAVRQRQEREREANWSRIVKKQAGTVTETQKVSFLDQLAKSQDERFKTVYRSLAGTFNADIEHDLIYGLAMDIMKNLQATNALKENWPKDN